LPWAQEAKKYCRVETRLECGFGDPTLPPPEPKKKRLLVFVVGVKERLYPIPAMRHIIAPAVRAGYEVDYYALFSTHVAGASSWRTYWYRPTANPRFANMTDKGLEEYLVRHARFYGAKNVGIHLMPDNVQEDVLPQHVFTGQRFLGENSGIGEDGKFTSSGTFWLFLKRLKKVETLWNWTIAHRMISDYDHVVWTRSDAYWVDDLDMSHFPDPWTVYSRCFGALCQKEIPNVVNDQSIVMGAHVASDILTAYSSFYTNSDPRLDKVGSSESFMQALARVRGVKWEIVRKDWFPFFLALHMSPSAAGEPVLCFRGVPRKLLMNPMGNCVHPAKVDAVAALCDDFELH